MKIQISQIMKPGTTIDQINISLKEGRETKIQQSIHLQQEILNRQQYTNSEELKSIIINPFCNG